MKRLTLANAVVFLLLAVPLFCADAALNPRQCPTVKVSCMDQTGCAESLTFTAETSGAAADAKLFYNWTVSAGTIMSGQGMPSITVDMTGLGGASVEATVQVTGLPEACAGKATCETALICDPIARKLDEYDNLRLSDEKARLDNFAIELQKDPPAQGYIICYGGRVGRAGEATRRCQRAKSYINGRRSIDATRIVTVDGGYKEKLTVELWIVDSGMNPPTASPTVDPSEVRFIKGKLKRRARRR